jgi:hypothetical protein
MLGVSRGDLSRLLFFVALLLLALASGANADEYCILCHGANGPHTPQCGDTTTCGVNCHQGKLDAIMHPFGAGTPMSDVTSTTGISTACRTCHQFPGSTHPFRINTAPGTVTQYPDLNQSCGQCHGGGLDSMVSPPQAGIVYLSQNQLGVIAPNLHSGSSQTALASIDCTLCHNGNPMAPSSVSHPTSSGTPGSGAAACRGCHAATGILHRRAAIDPVALCGSCHGGSQGTVVSPAPAFTAAQIAAVAPATHDSSQVQAINCDLCHADPNPVAESLSSMGHPQAPGTPGCLDCHTAPLHSGGTPSVNVIANNACSTCHGESGSSHKFTGFSDNPLVTFASSIHTKSDPGTACTGCHAERLSTMNYHIQSSLTPSRCETCHRYSKILSGQTTSTFYSRPGVVFTDDDHVCGQCHGGSSGPALSGLPYFTADQLTYYAHNIHNIKPTARFHWSTSSTTDYLVLYDATASTCPSGATCTYSWSTGETGITASHQFSNAATTTVTLTVTASTGGSNSASQAVTPKYVGSHPTTVSMSATVSGFTASGTYSVSGGIPPYTVTANWGDGSGTSTLTGGTFSHTYVNPGTYTITITATDSGDANGNYRTTGTASQTVTISAASSMISGIVTRANGTTPLPGARVLIKGTSPGTTSYILIAKADGTYSQSGLKAGTYDVSVTLSGYTFPTSPQTGVTPGSVVNFKSSL